MSSRHVISIQAADPVDGRHYKRVALVADTHGAFDTRIEERLSNFDCIIHAGDLGGWSVLNFDTQRALAVTGNNDVVSKWPDYELGVLRKLPEVLSLKLLGGDLVVIHGHQFPAVKTRHQKLKRAFPNAKAIVYGHSHRAIIDKQTKPWVLNPGASGKVRCYGGPSFIALTISSTGWRIRQITF